MNILCNQQLFTLDSILSTSKVIEDFKEFFKDELFNIPDEYFKIFSDQNLINIEDKLVLLKLYDFLNINKKYIKNLCKKIGFSLEQLENKIDIEEFLLIIIITYFPSLYFHKEYSTISISKKWEEELNKNKYAYISPWYHNYYHVDKDLIDYCKVGNLKMVKYLHQNGADITANNNAAIRWASRNGHLEVVKYLHQNGGDITADNNCAIRWASRNGHLEVVKYLHQNGCDISIDNNGAIRLTSL